ncbi:MAG: GNAT family N-acetyltransferase [Neisseriaceae bacterium]|nr:GNAT family N-acetyltransferase [Neisseriaceae bacterium]MBP6861820.1 GNAT family N-acetyltransferase [Neisseriaceae bacterium]
MILQGQRLHLRPFTAADAAAVYEYTCRPDVMHYLPEGVFDEAAAAAFVAAHAHADAPYRAVVLNDSQRLVGHLCFEPYFGRHSYEIGWVFHPDVQGQGYATEAAALLLAHAFGHMGVHRVIATCQPDNPASYKVMEKLGMRREGHFLACIPKGDEWWDEYYYAILAREWAESTRNTHE